MGGGPGTPGTPCVCCNKRPLSFDCMFFGSAAFTSLGQPLARNSDVSRARQYPWRSQRPPKSFVFPRCSKWSNHVTSTVQNLDIWVFLFTLFNDEQRGKSLWNIFRPTAYAVAVLVLIAARMQPLCTPSMLSIVEVSSWGTRRMATVQL